MMPRSRRKTTASVAPPVKDIISRLPREIALKVFSYLEPRDLFRAAQTCRNWRVLTNDNLPWRVKCQEAGIDRDFAPTWKAAFKHQHLIEANWKNKKIDSLILKGREDFAINCFHLCGNRILTGSMNQLLQIWSATTGDCLVTLVGHTGAVNSSFMLGDTVISGSADCTVKVWDARTGLCTRTLRGHSSSVGCIHPHGSKVVSGSWDRTVRLWDIESGECHRVLVGHIDEVNCLQYDGRLVVSSAHKMIKIWDPVSETCLHTLLGHTTNIYSLEYDGVHVISGSFDRNIRVWAVSTGQCLHVFSGLGSPYNLFVDTVTDNSNVLVTAEDFAANVWNYTTGECLQTFSEIAPHQSSAFVKFKKKFVISSTLTRSVKLWDSENGTFIRNLFTPVDHGEWVLGMQANRTKLVILTDCSYLFRRKLIVLDFDCKRIRKKKKGGRNKKNKQQQNEQQCPTE